MTQPRESSLLQEALHGEGWSSPTRPRARHSHIYFVWPSDYQMARAACATLSSALQEAARAQRQGVTDVWIIRSDGYAVQAGCTYCGSHEEARRVASHPQLRDYWCLACWEILGVHVVTRRLSPLQQHILRWLKEDTQHTQRVIASSHAALVKAMPADKGNVSKSLKNLAEKHYITLYTSTRGYITTVQLTPLGSYRASTLPQVVTNEVINCILHNSRPK